MFGELLHGGWKFCILLYKEVYHGSTRGRIWKDGLSDADRIKIENAMLDLAYENSYAVLTHEISFEDLLAEKAKFGVSAILSFDPMDGPRKKDIEDIISYYVGLDEPEYYLRCAELKKILDREEFIV